MEKNRVHYEYYHLGNGTENVPEDYTEIFFVCLREDGLELPATIENSLPDSRKKSTGA